MDKAEELKKIFAACTSPEAKYEKIIELGRQLPPFAEQHKTEENLVFGCQSLLYLHSYAEKGRIYFSVYSDALISKGLAALLLYVYQGSTLATVEEKPPTFLGELGLQHTLSPSRSNGLLGLYLKMRKQAKRMASSCP